MMMLRGAVGQIQVGTPQIERLTSVIPIDTSFGSPVLVLTEISATRQVHAQDLYLRYRDKQWLRRLCFVCLTMQWKVNLVRN